MSETVAEPDVTTVGRDRRSSRGAFKRLSHRTPLRTKLITAVLALVIMALGAISIASVWLLSSYLTTQYDAQLKSTYNSIITANIVGTAGLVYPQRAQIIAGIQPPGSQLTWRSGTGGNLVPGGIDQQQTLPKLPTGTGWAGTDTDGQYVTVAALEGDDSWRLLATTINYPVTNSSGTTQTEPCTLVVAVDLGNINATITRVEVFDLVVSVAIILVLAVVAAAVVRANLRPLNDIELTAGQIAAGHLDHRVPEGDPHTEVGSLGRSLNAMLSQIERAFRAQEASERSAHESEERMRRFIADASHELRTPLTTIRGFAAHYRQRGGARGFLTGGSAAETQDLSSRTGAAVPAFVNGASGGGYSESAGESAGTVLSGTVRTNGAGANETVANGAGEAGGSPGEDLDHLMARVESEATRMGLLVEDLLTLARLDQQRPLSMAPVDLLTLAADAVQDARIVSPNRPIDLVVAPGTAFIVNGDESRLRQVLANLVNNALTHTPAETPIRVKIASGTVVPPKSTGGPAADADIAADANPFAEAGTSTEAGALNGAGGTDAVTGAGSPVPAVVLDVEDDGPGMSADQAQRVFERFYRADAARNRASGGTGLGLAIVAGLVAAHGGTVAVRTAPGRGADFQVRLPLSPDALAADPDDE